MVNVKKGDFVELQYTGKMKLGDKVFDTSDEEIAKTNNIHKLVNNMNQDMILSLNVLSGSLSII